MSYAERYESRELFRISHEYYCSGEMPLGVALSDKSRDFLKECKLKITRSGPILACHLIRPQGWQPKEADDTENESAVFLLSPQTGEFYYRTAPGEIETKKPFVIRESTLPKVWKTLEVPWEILAGEISEPAEIRFPAPRKFLEFILISKFNPPDIPLRLREAKASVPFREIEPATLPDGKPARRIVSAEAVSLRDNLNYKFSLFEEKEHGERPLSNSVPAPKPDEISMTDPKNTITTYFYY